MGDLVGPLVGDERATTKGWPVRSRPLAATSVRADTRAVDSPSPVPGRAGRSPDVCLELEDRRGIATRKRERGSLPAADFLTTETIR